MQTNLLIYCELVGAQLALMLTQCLYRLDGHSNGLTNAEKLMRSALRCGKLDVTTHKSQNNKQIMQSKSPRLVFDRKSHRKPRGEDAYRNDCQ
jgi:hypothetical protein